MLPNILFLTSVCSTLFLTSTFVVVYRDLRSGRVGFFRSDPARPEREIEIYVGARTERETEISVRARPDPGNFVLLISAQKAWFKIFYNRSIQLLAYNKCNFLPMIYFFRELLKQPI